MDNPLQSEIHSLIEYFYKTSYRVHRADETAKTVMQKCVELAKLDYNVSVIDNSSGELCAHYPSQLIIMESEKSPSGELIKDTIYEGIDPNRMRELITKARTARCRTRFPVPVIFYQGKYICRSATLSGGPEIYGRSGYDYLAGFYGREPAASNAKPETEETDVDKDDMKMIINYEDSKDNNMDDNNKQANNTNNSANNWVLCDQVRKDDIKLLESLSVGTIVDLMTEKKKIKFCLKVTSSEKVDKEKRYSQFTILSLPYPGCEFFKEYRDQNYTTDNLYFNWCQPQIDAEIKIPLDSITEKLNLNWNEYKTWNLKTLTKNYLMLMLRYVFDSGSGLLVHCISGWDRTPLFVSLLRICLWADGAIHKSLTPSQILYFTIGYDWLLFGHNLKDRKDKGEDIFYFCFHFLKNLMGDEFSTYNCHRGTTDKLMTPEYMQCDGADMEEGITCSHGSNYSLDSSWSSISSKSQEIAPLCQAEDLNNFNGGIWFGESCSQPQRNSECSQNSSSSPPSQSSSTVNDNSETQRFLMAKMSSQAASTSPVAVPTRTSFRQRNESTSSLSVGSWQYVTSTGSLRSNCGSTISSNSRASGADAVMTDSVAALIDGTQAASIADSGMHSQCGTHCAMRRERLDKIRKLFTNCYCQSIGHNLKDGSDSSHLSSIVGNISNFASGITNISRKS